MKPAGRTIQPVELVCYVVLGFCLIMTLDLALDWAGRRWSIDILELGRRRDLGFVIALVAGLWLNNRIASALGLKPLRRRSELDSGELLP